MQKYNMKLYLTVVLLLVGAYTSCMAQIDGVQFVNMTMSQGSQDGFKVLIPEVGIRQTSKAWVRLMREYGGKTSSIQNSEEKITTGAVIPAIEDSSVIVYANVNETPEGVYLYVFIQGAGTFYSSASPEEKVIAAKELLTNFATTTAYEAVNQQVRSASKDLEKLQKEQRSLEKDKMSFEKEILEAHDLITKRTEDLEANSKAQIANQNAILEQKTKINIIKTEMLKYKK